MARRRPAPTLSAAERTEDHYRQVADELARRLEEGTAPWTQSWKPGDNPLPRNALTGKPYRGGNSVWLASVAQMRGYDDCRWGTFKQALELGGHVRKGERGTTVVYWQWETRRIKRDAAGRPQLDKDGQPAYERRKLERPRAYPWTVFNAAQCDGLPEREATAARQAGWDPVAAAERVLSGSRAEIEHNSQDRAYYNLGSDRIHLPFREQFPDASSYYNTALHELGHWSGHPDRLDRETLLRGIREGPSSAEYAREELRAEIAAMISADRLELARQPERHAAYVGHWIKNLREDPRELYRAAQDAQGISDYVLEFGREREPGREPPAGQSRQRPPRTAPEPRIPPPPQLPEPASGGQYRMFHKGR